jgi:hypothetical protein
MSLYATCITSFYPVSSCRLESYANSIDGNNFETREKSRGESDSAEASSVTLPCNGQLSGLAGYRTQA